MADIRINVTIKTDPKKVYDAITTQEGLAAWWCKQAIAKPEEGFTNVFTFDTNRIDMNITGLKPGKRVDWKVVNATGEWMNTNVSFDLEEKNGNTFLRFAHSDWRAVTDMFGICTYDWSKFLKSLKDLCETGKGTPA